MVLVRKREDGQFFTNRGGSRSYYRKQGGWSPDPSECKPFVNERGARWSFLSYVPRTKNCTHFKLLQMWCPKHEMKDDCRHYKKRSDSCACEKARRADQRERFDSRYEIVEVKLTPQIP